MPCVGSSCGDAPSLDSRERRIYNDTCLAGECWSHNKDQMLAIPLLLTVPSHPLRTKPKSDSVFGPAVNHRPYIDGENAACRD